MVANDFRDRLRQRAFHPFVVVTFDGTTYEIPDPDLVIVGLASVVIGVPSEEAPGLARRIQQASLRHVVRSETTEEHTKELNEDGLE
jgi:hypothetical protein